MGSPLDAGRRIARLVGTVDNAPGVIRAYHGSPHSFSRFDASKIGTGQGAQASGHGLYFAGNEAVARTYRDLLAKRGMDLRDPLHVAALWYDAKGGREEGIAGILAVMDDDAKSQFPPSYEHRLLHQRALDHLRAGSALPTVPKGHMYEVEIGYPEEAFLDMDSPVGGHPKAVRDALGEFASAPSHFIFGQEGWRGNNAYFRAAEQLASPAEASRLFKERGIPGLRYWDGNSRAAGEGTRNYVMFPGTEDRIRILRQYGLLPPLVAAGAMQEE